jgi:serine/threonine-protein kinase
MSALPNEIFGYRVIARLGEGAASQLYAVQDAKTKQVWALKHVVRRSPKDERFVEQVEIEHEVGSKLDHPNVRGIGKLHRNKKIFGGTTEIGLCLELVDADTMDRRIPRSMADAVRQFAEIGRGLAHMHERGYAHADMKPINAMVCDGGAIKIIDLGQACKLGTQKKRIQGTPGYIAPEQASRDPITAATDIYNLGATMYWVLMREVMPTVLPPQGEAELSTMSSRAVQPPDPPHRRNPAIPAALGELVIDCVQVAPEDRVPSMSEVVRRLEEIGETLAGGRAVTAGPRVAERVGK